MEPESRSIVASSGLPPRFSSSICDAVRLQTPLLERACERQVASIDVNHQSLVPAG